MNDGVAGRDVESAGKRRDLIVLAAMALALVVVSLWGGRLEATRNLKLHAAPFFGYWSLELGWPLALAAAVAVVVVRWGEQVASRMGWTSLLVVAFVVSIGWGLSLALTDGVEGIVRGVSSDHDYLVVVDDVAGPGEFVRTFLDDIERYTVHVRGHPPGLVPILWWLDRAGLTGRGPASIMMILAGGSSVVAALVTTRALADEDRARAVAPFLALSPAFVWIVTSADALFLSVGAWAVALLVGATSRSGRRSDACALAGGAVLAGGLFLSYGLLLIGLVPLAVVVARRRWRVLVAAAAGAAGVFAFFWAAFGFWWLDGLSATRAEYFEGIGAVRPFAYFVVANIVVFAFVVGPGAVVGLSRLNDEQVWMLVGGALVAVAIADASGLSKGEVERIWLPFVPWVSLAALGLRARHRRWWLAGQGASAIALETFLYTHW